jgi:hypothetical protein
MDESLEASSYLLSFIRPPAFRAARQLAAIRAKMMECFSMGWYSSKKTKAKKGRCLSGHIHSTYNASCLSAFL